MALTYSKGTEKSGLIGSNSPIIPFLLEENQNKIIQFTAELDENLNIIKETIKHYHSPNLEESS